MFYTFAILLVFQCLGEASVFVLGLNIPGPVVGMLLLFFALLASPRLMAKIEESSHHVLKHMGNASAAVELVHAAGAIPDHVGHRGRAPVFLDNHLHAVGQHALFGARFASLRMRD